MSAHSRSYSHSLPPALSSGVTAHLKHSLQTSYWPSTPSPPQRPHPHPHPHPPSLHCSYSTPTLPSTRTPTPLPPWQLTSNCHCHCHCHCHCLPIIPIPLPPPLPLPVSPSHIHPPSPCFWSHRPKHLQSSILNLPSSLFPLHSFDKLLLLLPACSQGSIQLCLYTPLSLSLSFLFPVPTRAAKSYRLYETPDLEKTGRPVPRSLPRSSSSVRTLRGRSLFNASATNRANQSCPVYLCTSTNQPTTHWSASHSSRVALTDRKATTGHRLAIYFRITYPIYPPDFQHNPRRRSRPHQD